MVPAVTQLLEHRGETACIHTSSSVAQYQALFMGLLVVFLIRVRWWASLNLIPVNKSSFLLQQPTYSLTRILRPFVTLLLLSFSVPPGYNDVLATLLSSHAFSHLWNLACAGFLHRSFIIIIFLMLSGSLTTTFYHVLMQVLLPLRSHPWPPRIRFLSFFQTFVTTWINGKCRALELGTRSFTTWVQTQIAMEAWKVILSLRFIFYTFGGIISA